MDTLPLPEICTARGKRYREVAHPFVRSGHHPSVPTCLPRRCYAILGAGGVRVCGSVATSASRSLYNLPEAEVGSASNSSLAVPSKSVLLLTLSTSPAARQSKQPNRNAASIANRSSRHARPKQPYDSRLSTHSLRFEASLLVSRAIRGRTQ